MRRHDNADTADLQCRVADLPLAELAELDRWMAWRTENVPGKTDPAKVPYAATGSRKGKSTDPATWGTKSQAQKRADRLDKPHGMGGVAPVLGDIGDGRILAGIDLDTCRDSETGRIAPWAERAMELADTYTEMSPSGTGYKLFFVLDARDWSRKLERSKFCENTGGKHPPGIEVYVTDRYFAWTGEHLQGTPRVVRAMSTEAMKSFLEFAEKTFPPKAAVKGHRVGRDQSRSAKAFASAARAKRAGQTFDQWTEAAALDPETASWVGEVDQRQLDRAWENAGEAVADELVLNAGSPLKSAREFVVRHHTSDELRTLHHQNGTFYEWRDSHYVERPAEGMRAALYRFLDGAKSYNKDRELVDFDPNKMKVANVLDACAGATQLEHTIRPPAWIAGGDNPPAAEMIACANVLLHLPTRRAVEHTPDFFTLNALEFDYQPKAREPVEWLKFLNAVWPNDQQAIDTLQEMFGLLLTADTKYQKAFLLVGPRRCGKGTIARTLTDLLGSANVCNPTLSSLSQNFGIEPLIGKRAAIIGDARLGGKTDHQVIAERILSISGEDALTIDRKYASCWTGKLDARFLILTNELPRLTDSSGALASRFITLTMKQSFFGREDLGLAVRIRPELPGILLWAIKGWERLTARGYFVPPASSDAVQRVFEDLGSPIGAFVRDRCIVEQGRGVQVDALYEAWCEWCEEQGRDHPGNKQTFGRDLNTVVLGLEIEQPRVNGRRVRYYSGIGLAPR